MKYLLFINFSSGLRHNNVYNTLDNVSESIIQLVQEEGLKVKKEKIPNAVSIKKHLERNDDYFGQLSNGTWYHVFNHILYLLKIYAQRFNFRINNFVGFSETKLWR